MRFNTSHKKVVIVRIFLSVFLLAGLIFNFTIIKAEASGILPPNNPASNVPPNPNFNNSCSYTGSQDNSVGCYLAALTAIDNAILGEGSTPLDMPSNFLSLTYPQQLYVISNEERVARGLTPITGITSQLDSAAQTAADNSQDPVAPSGYNYTSWGSNWAGGLPSALASDYMWMYEDGPGGGNLDCTSTNTSGCWGHRDNILGSYQCNPCSQGDGYSNNPAPIDGQVYSPSYTELFVGDDSGQQLSYTFTWSQVLANLVPSPSVSSLSTQNVVSGQQVTIYGSNLTDTTEVLVGTNIITNFTQVSSSQISFSVPQIANGSYTVQTLTPGGISNSTSSSELTVGPIPNPPTNVYAVAGDQQAMVTWTAPTSASPITGYTVSVYIGNVLQTTVNVSGTPPNNFISVGSLTNGQSYTFEVSATDVYGTSSNSSVSNSVIPSTSSLPQVAEVSPGSGPITGNSTVTILGVNFNGTTGVNFGSIAAVSFSVISNTEITAVSSAVSSPATVNVEVVNSSGTSSTSTQDQFQYLSGSPYFPLTPFRIMDTRPSSGYNYAGQKMLPNQVDPLTVVGTFGTQSVPTNASSVVLNVTITDAQSTGGFLTIYPYGSSEPTTSNINWNAGDTKATLVIVKVGSGGQIDIANGPIGSTDVVVDVMGYYGPYVSATDQGAFVSLNPDRLIDTRPNSGFEGSGQTLSAGSTTNFQITGVGDLPSAGVSAVVLEITVTDTSSNGGYLTVWPTGQTQPETSVVNWSQGETIANRVVVGVDQSSSNYGQISVYNPFGTTDLVVDVEGYFTAQSVSPGSLDSQIGYFNPIVPFRVCDTRANTNNQCTGDTLTSTNQQITINIAGLSSGSSSVPSDTSATPPVAVVANITAANTTQWSFLTVWPTGQSQPGTSDLNWTAAIWATSNMDEVLLGGGQLNIANPFGSTDVIVDVFGWYS